MEWGRRKFRTLVYKHGINADHILERSCSTIDGSYTQRILRNWLLAREYAEIHREVVIVASGQHLDQAPTKICRWIDRIGEDRANRRGCGEEIQVAIKRAKKASDATALG